MPLKAHKPLIIVCIILRYHNIGILVLFLHDISDIQLEFTKVNVYFKTRGGKQYLINDVLSNMGSISFSITWWGLLIFQETTSSLLMHI